MLVLSRKEGESIICTLPDGNEIEITMIDVIGSQVKIGITAPEAVMIVREELLYLTA